MRIRNWLGKTSILPSQLQQRRQVIVNLHAMTLLPDARGPNPFDHGLALILHANLALFENPGLPTHAPIPGACLIDSVPTVEGNGDIRSGGCACLSSDIFACFCVFCSAYLLDFMIICETASIFCNAPVFICNPCYVLRRLIRVLVSITPMRMTACCASVHTCRTAFSTSVATIPSASRRYVNAHLRSCLYAYD